MFRRVFATALIAGALCGLGISAVQELTTTPLILHAETFEKGGHNALDSGIRFASRAFAHGDAAAGAPIGGLERTLYTTLANVLTGVGFALLLAACFALAARPVDGRTGILWGIAGFATVNLAPALGLPPEVPGAMTADLAARQGWWLLCAASTAAGLWAMAFRGGAVWTALGIALLAAPHLIGAPRPDEVGGAVPPEIAAHFAAASLVTAAIFWCGLGWLSGALWKRFA